jgi:hypothetical protein
MPEETAPSQTKVWKLVVRPAGRVNGRVTEK